MTTKRRASEPDRALVGAARLALRRGQRRTLLVLVAGYAGYYLCRSNFSVCLPLLAEELAAGGLGADAARMRLGEIASLGILVYAAGKFVNGTLTDFLGGRRSFLSGMGLSVACTLLFALGGGVPVFTLAWMGNRAFQSMGWPGMVKIASRWFPRSSYARAMALLSLSFLFGDALARAFMGGLIGAGAGWRTVFFVAAAVLLALFGVCAVALRETPAERGVEEPPPHPENLFAGREAVPHGVRALLGPFLRSPSFWTVCLLSLGMTLLRETFNTWTPTFLVDRGGLDEGAAASASAVFPLLGGVSVLLAGFVGDRAGRRGRARVIVGGLLLSGLAILALARMPAGAAGSAIGLLSLTGFLLIGPYSYLAGAISLDFGGKRGAATACGLIDGVGYLGGVLAGGGVARLTVLHGWEGALGALAAVSFATAGAGLLFLRQVGRDPGADPATRPAGAS